MKQDQRLGLGGNPETCGLPGRKRAMKEDHMASATHSTSSLLVLRALKLGDLLVAVPALKGLRAAFPRHRLLLAAPEWLRPVVGLIDAVDELVPLPGLSGQLPAALNDVDVAVNLHGNGPESRYLLDSLNPKRRIGHAAPRWDGVAWCQDMHERMRWTRMLQWHGITADPNDVSIAVPGQPSGTSGATVIHVGASHGSRHWPVQHFAAVARGLQAEGDSVVLTGDRNDAARTGDVARLAGLDTTQDLAGRLTLTDLAALVASAKLVISVDTGAAHLASAYGTPSVVLFGPAAPAQWGPPPGPHVVLTEEALRHGDLFSAEPDPALLAVLPHTVLDAAATLSTGMDSRRRAR